MRMKINNNVDINLREEFNTLTDDYGYYALLIRKSEMNCPICSSQEGQQYSGVCPSCLGIGRRIKIERIKLLGQQAAQVIATPNNSVYTNVGDIYSDAKAYYVKYDINPHVGDFIYEVSFDKFDRVVNLHGCYKIEYSEPYRMDNGRSEYKICSTHRENTNITIKEGMLKELMKRL